MLNAKKPLDLSFSDLDYLIQIKLLSYLKDEKINHTDYINCSRGLSAIMNYLTAEEANESQKHW